MIQFKEIGMEKVIGEVKMLKNHLDLLGIKPFLMAGPLLGAIREGTLIAHDRDIDLGVMDEHDLEVVYKELGGLYKAWMTGLNIPAGMTLWLERNQVLFEFQCHYPHKHVVFYNREMDDTWKTYETHVEYPVRLFREFKTIRFLEEDWQVPNPPEEWLDVFYGPDWRAPQEYADWRYHCPIFLSGYLSVRPLEP